MKRNLFLSLALGLLALAAATDLNAVADDTRQPWTSSHVKGAPQPPAPYKLVPSFPEIHFEKPTCIEEVPHANRLLVTEIGGKVFTVAKQADAKRADLAIDLAVTSKGRVSLLDADFHPAFENNRHVFSKV